ncbi:toxin co-regulated pilus biosynthesis Q family protein (plasmid) [Paraburkholderia sp. D15]|uniref:toxin co-regulated pilus biosynthesis Q family protein n=1 Tax=Paraburkholderia sp. D15 TaxID=2880218 RepID=UPI00247A4852|nr:toxin co-regulated pilus biosynthesis Q family protein [Paraburkholderia sp. D15]WGS55112.1 toxin co-regulated pilus biosynthesis Q family protein [Paraburkholderia sp. D15]
MKILGAVALAGAASCCAAADTPAPKSDDGWQILSTSATATMPVAQSVAADVTQPLASAGQSTPQPLTVTAVVLPGAPSAPSGDLTLSITPQDVNLRNALDRWLQTQGWQLAWKIDDDLPLEFNATFSGDFTSVLTQVMQATNHMRTPTRVCRHTNKVIRVVARAANCKD